VFCNQGTTTGYRVILQPHAMIAASCLVTATPSSMNQDQDSEGSAMNDRMPTAYIEQIPV
jgi:hypothetical protein